MKCICIASVALAALGARCRNCSSHSNGHQTLSKFFFSALGSQGIAISLVKGKADLELVRSISAFYKREIMLLDSSAAGMKAKINADLGR